MKVHDCSPAPAEQEKRGLQPREKAILAAEPALKKPLVNSMILNSEQHNERECTIDVASFIVFYFVLANVPFWLASHFLGLQLKGYFCIEYLLAALIALLFPRQRIMISSLLIILVAFDILCGTCLTFYLHPIECLEQITALYLLPTSRLMLIGLIVTVSAGVAAISITLPVMQLQKRRRMILSAALLAMIILGVMFDLSSRIRLSGKINVPTPFNLNTLTDSYKTSSIGKINLFRYPILHLADLQTEEFGYWHLTRLGFAHAGSMPSAVGQNELPDILLRHDSYKQKPDLVLVLVESWGAAINTQLHDALIASYRDSKLQNRYSITEGTIPFSGSTVYGEGRELCSSSMGLYILNASRAELSNCLPTRLDNAGYNTVAVHGMSRFMFDRATWYPKIGFHEIYFLADLQNMGMPECKGAFSGICDASIGDWIGKRLQMNSSQPEFIYWLTLNSHLPVPSPPQLSSPASCSIAGIAPEQSSLCSWYQLIAEVHHSVAKIATEDTQRPTIFVVVGDHAPPFADPNAKGRFSDSVVPWLVLMPRVSN